MGASISLRLRASRHGPLMSNGQSVKKEKKENVSPVMFNGDMSKFKEGL